MRDKIHLLFGSLSTENSEQSQTEAILELLIMTMYADKTLKIEEDEAIKKYIETLEW